MISVYDLKPRFQAFLHPILVILARHGVTPNMITMTALMGSMATGGLLLLARTHPAWLLLMPAWLLVRMALNALDGMLAREFGMATPSGAVLNEVGDVVSDLVLYLPLARVEPSAAFSIVLFGMGALLTEFCGVLGQALGAARRYDGPMGKSDRAFWVSILFVGTSIFHRFVGVWKWGFLGMAVLCVWTCGNRVRPILRQQTPHNMPPEGGTHDESI